MRPSGSCSRPGGSCGVRVRTAVSKSGGQRTTFPSARRARFVGDYVRIVHAQNTGAAFGLLPERTTSCRCSPSSRSSAIVYYYRQIASNSALVSRRSGMQLGGGSGICSTGSPGIRRRLRRRGVGDIRFWAFNVADSSIVGGSFWSPRLCTRTRAATAEAGLMAEPDRAARR